MAKTKELLETLQDDLWEAACQIKALGEMISFQDRDAAAFDEKNIWFGIGSLLREIGERLEAWSKKIDEQSVQKKRKGKKNVKRSRTM